MAISKSIFMYPLWGLILIIFAYVNNVHGAAVMSVDLGNEWMKVGVVSPGVPMEIALNKESKRKTPAVLAFRDGIRTFGEDAQTIGVKFPSKAYGYLLDLLGKTLDNPIVDLFRKRFPYYEIIGDKDRNTVVFKEGDNEYKVEELVAQILAKAREFAENSVKQAITECVLIVPGFFGQAERNALLTAANLADIKVLQLINDYTAVALNYGVFNRATINETAQYYIYYDMGAQKTSAAVVSYQLVKDKVTKEKNPVIQILGVGFDRTLGGLEIQLRLRDYLADEFNAMKRTKTDVKKNPRALAKLFKEAGRLKNVLSANNDHTAQIENLIEDHDFKLHITREKLEELCTDIWPKVVAPLKQALKNSGLTMDVINQVILFGGGTRVPKIQEILKAEIKQELGKSLNADEAATMGAVYKAADLATGFKVKKFVVKDAVIFPIHVAFERDPGDGTAVRQVKRTLFNAMNPYPQKKVITFNKHNNDFDIYVNYADLSHLSPEEISYMGTYNLTLIELTNVNDILQNNQNEKTESKGIKAHFALDDSGLFDMTGVEFVFEKEKIEQEEESAFSKIGSTFSKLFNVEPNVEKKEEKKDDNESENESDSEKEEKPKDEKSEEKLDEKNNSTESKTTNGTESAAKNETVKVVIEKIPVPHKLTLQFVPPLSHEAYDVTYRKLENINKEEYDRTRRESVFNDLESHVIETQDKLTQEEYSSCATEEEKKNILEECKQISDWLYDGGEEANVDELEKRLNNLRKLTNNVFARHWEHDERPEALKALNGILEHAKKFLSTAKNLTKENNPEKDVFTGVELETLDRIITDTIQWQKIETKEQKKLKRNDDIRLTVKDISEKMASLDREVKYLLNKLKIWRPKTTPKPKQDNDKKTNKTTTDDEQVEEKLPTDEKEQTIENNDSNNKDEQIEEYEPEIVVENIEEKPVPNDKETVTEEADKKNTDDENHVEL